MVVVLLPVGELLCWTVGCAELANLAVVSAKVVPGVERAEPEVGGPEPEVPMVNVDMSSVILWSLVICFFALGGCTVIVEPFLWNCG